MKKKIKELRKCTNIRINRLERDISYLQNCIDIILSGNKAKITILYSARKVQKQLENAIFKGDGKNKTSK